MINTPALDTLPVRLAPGTDLKGALEELIAREHLDAAFVIAGIGSLSSASIRFAGRKTIETLEGPFEILTLQGSLSADGSHLHLSIADANGAVYGGHLAHGCPIYTTAEILVARLPGYRFRRTPDGATGHRELCVERDVDAPDRS